MNGEWIYVEIIRWMLTLVLAYIAYRLGLRSQKIQVLREYITDIVQKEYPALNEEMTINSETLDNYLEKPNVNFDFSELSKFCDRGLDEFMKRHHRDLHSMVNSFHKNILPKFNELKIRELMERLFDISSHQLRESLPREAVDTSERIASVISKIINPYYIIPDLLNDRDEEVRNKIEKCIRAGTSHIYREKAERPFVIKGQTDVINYDRISQMILGKAKPEATYLVDKFKKLKKINDREVKGKLLPLLQKYISNPI